METAVLEAIKAGLASIKEFMLEKQAAAAAPLKEEMDRLTARVTEMTGQLRDAQRAGIQTPGAQRGVIPSGPYEGMDGFDLAIMRAAINAERRRTNDPTLHAKWEQQILGETKTHSAALDSTTAGAGDELVPTAESSRIWMDVNLNTLLLQEMMRVDMPTNPYEEPIQLGDMNFYPGQSNIAGIGSTPTTARVTLTAHEIVGHVELAYDLEEDSVVPVLSAFRESMSRNLREVIEDILLNADTSVTNGINSDGATISNTDAGKAQWLIGFDGLRHACLIDNTSMANSHGAAPDADMFNEARRNMGKYGANPNGIVHVMDVGTFIKSQTIDEVQTLEQFGPQATILNGQLAAIEGVPVIVSGKMLLTASDGKVTDGVAGTVGSVLTVSRQMWHYGMRREIKIESDRDILKRQHILAASFRIALQEGTGSKSSQTHTHLQYNITV